MYSVVYFIKEKQNCPVILFSSNNKNNITKFMEKIYKDYEKYPEEKWTDYECEHFCIPVAKTEKSILNILKNYDKRIIKPEKKIPFITCPVDAEEDEIQNGKEEKEFLTGVRIVDLWIFKTDNEINIFEIDKIMKDVEREYNYELNKEADREQRYAKYGYFKNEDGSCELCNCFNCKCTGSSDSE